MKGALLSALIFCVAVSGGPAELSADQWRSDLAYLAKQMPLVHRNLFHTMTPAAFREAIDRLNAEIPQLNDDEIRLRIFTIAAMPTDSHTGPGPRSFAADKCFPLRLRHYSDGLYVEAAPPEYADAVGGRVVRIGNSDADVAYSKILTFIPHDTGNPGLLEVLAPLLLTSGRVLHGLGYEPTATSATYAVLKNGRLRSFTLSAEVSMRMLYGHAPIPGFIDARSAGVAPLWLQHPDRTFWATYLPGKRLFYVQLNAIEDDKAQTLAAFFAGVFRQAGKLPVEKFVLDIRTNDGGDNKLIAPIIVGFVRLQSIARPGHFFVIISRNTYSAAQNLVNRLETYTSPIFVGQPTGQHVNSYGDPGEVELPQSHLRAYMASVWWQDDDERDKRIETTPQLRADPTFEGYVANRDAALDAILAYPKATAFTVVTLSERSESKGRASEATATGR